MFRKLHSLIAGGKRSERCRWSIQRRGDISNSYFAPGMLIAHSFVFVIAGCLTHNIPFAVPTEQRPVCKRRRVALQMKRVNIHRRGASRCSRPSLKQVPISELRDSPRQGFANRTRRNFRRMESIRATPVQRLNGVIATERGGEPFCSVT